MVRINDYPPIHEKKGSVRPLIKPRASWIFHRGARSSTEGSGTHTGAASYHTREGFPRMRAETGGSRSGTPTPIVSCLHETDFLFFPLFFSPLTKAMTLTTYNFSYTD